MNDWNNDWDRDPIRYYGRDGQPISLDQYARLHADMDYKRVALDTVGGYTVSTVWLGLDHGFGLGPPIIFETMVFTSEAWEHGPLSDVDTQRYSAEAEALAGHEEMVTLIRATQGTELLEDGAEGER